MMNKINEKYAKRQSVKCARKMRALGLGQKTMQILRYVNRKLYALCECNTLAGVVRILHLIRDIELE